MFIVWGSRGYSKNLGKTYIKCECQNCFNEVNYVAQKIGRKFTFFWIPIFNFSSKYYLICPICGQGEQDSKKNVLQTIL